MILGFSNFQNNGLIFLILRESTSETVPYRRCCVRAMILYWTAVVEVAAANCQVQDSSLPWQYPPDDDVLSSCVDRLAWSFSLLMFLVCGQILITRCGFEEGKNYSISTERQARVSLPIYPSVEPPLINRRLQLA